MTFWQLSVLAAVLFMIGMICLWRASRGTKVFRLVDEGLVEKNGRRYCPYCGADRGKGGVENARE